jgi:hypothetical protein
MVTLLTLSVRISFDKREAQFYRFPDKKQNYLITTLSFVYADLDFCFLFSWCGVRLSPLGTSATIWLIVPAPVDRSWVWSSRWNENWQGKPKYSEKTCPSAALSTTNPTWPDLGSNPGRRGGKPATNRLSCGTAKVCRLNNDCEHYTLFVLSWYMLSIWMWIC